MTNLQSAQQFSQAWLTDPRVFAVNRLAAHSSHKFYDHAPQCGEAMDLKQSLDGQWRVQMVDLADLADNELAEAAFAQPGYDAAGFSPIEVPSALETKGFLNHQYVNQQYPWSGHESPVAPDVPKHNHVALYRHEFSLEPKAAAVLEANKTAADDAAKRRVTLTFQGAATAIVVWLNGAFIGYAEDSFTPSEFDVTDVLRDGVNTLAVACFEFSSASWLEDQDFWRLHGIFRSVELEAQPLVHVNDLRVLADYDHTTGEGSLDVTALVRNAGTAAAVAATVLDAAGNIVWHGKLTAGADAETLTVKANVGKVNPWSADLTAWKDWLGLVIQ